MHTPGFGRQGRDFVPKANISAFHVHRVIAGFIYTGVWYVKCSMNMLESGAPEDGVLSMRDMPHARWDGLAQISANDEQPATHNKTMPDSGCCSIKPIFVPFILNYHDQCFFAAVFCFGVIP